MPRPRCDGGLLTHIRAERRKRIADPAGALRLNLQKTPLMVVEVRSPSTARFDTGTKRLTYEAAGVAWYWMVDPREPRLTVLQLVDGAYREVASVAGDEVYESADPISVRVVPRQLVSD